MKLLAFVALTLVCGTAAARDVGQIPANSDPKISTWFRTAKSPSGTACCDEADGYREGVPVKVAGGEPTGHLPIVVGHVRRLPPQSC